MLHLNRDIATELTIRKIQIFLLYLNLHLK